MQFFRCDLQICSDLQIINGLTMSNKVVELQGSNEVSTTPRRLRSGTHYGDHHIQAQLTSKKENKKLTKELNQNCDTDNLFKADENKASKHYPIILDDKQVKRQKAHMSVPSVIASPDQNQKNHTLKAILESIEPNLCIKVKNKSSKRKSLRDLLDKKFSMEKADLEEKQCNDKEQKRKTENRPVVKNGENHHHSNHDSKETVDTNYYCTQKTNPVVTKKQTTLHTCTTTQNHSVEAIKEKPLDDFWPMTRNHLEKNSMKTSSSVELRIKAGHSRDMDDCSQTFRISCSRPEASASSPTALPRTMKPDIVLKVRPRSSSLSALNVPAVSSSQGRPESSSRLYSTITSLSLKNSSDLRSNHKLKPLSAQLSSQGESRSLTAKQGDCSADLKPTSHFSNVKSFTLDQVDHEDVLEESKLPPVARTVELLSEPHDYHLDHSDTTDRFSGYCSTGCNHHDSRFVSHVQSSPESRATPPSAFRSSCEGEDSDEMEGGKKKGSTKECHRRKYNSRHLKTGKTAMFLGGDSASASVAVREREKKREEEEEEERWTNECGRYLPLVKTQMDKTVDDKETSAKLSDAPYQQEDTGSTRRRRKGRPSRRSSAERRWLTAHLCFSPHDGEEGEEEEEEEWRREREGRSGRKEGSGGGEDRVLTSVGMGKSAARCRSASLESGCDVSTTIACTTTTRKGMVKRQGESSSGGRRSRKGMDQETLWANPELDTHGFLLWASENRSELERRVPDASGVEVEAQLAAQWRQLPFSAKLHFLCRARDASSDHSKHTNRKKKAAPPTERKETSPSDGRSVYEEFLRLPQDRQKDLLRKWLRFFQKMLPRLEYQDFIGDFKKACKSLSLRPMPARRKNARLRNLDPSHYQMLFEKIRETRPRVMSVYNKRKAREEQLLSQSFCAMVRRLIVGQPWPFVRGCRSKVLGELLKDIQQLEVEEVLAQIDLPLSLTSADLADPFLDVKDLQDPLGALCPVDVIDSASQDSISCQSGTTLTINTKDAGHPRKGTNGTSVCSVMTGSTVTPHGDSGELPDSPVVLKVLDSLRHVVDLPVLDQRCLDSIFLAPPSRGSRSQTCRDTQFQNSATYRRTLLYKHIQPLLDARGMPLPSSALYHTHSAQYFYSDDR